MTNKPDNSVPALPDTQDPEFLKAVKEALEVRLDQRGADSLDASPTWRKLIEFGFAGLVQNGSVHSGAGGVIGDTPVIPSGYTPGSFGFPDGDSEIDWSKDTSIPDPPTNVTVNELLGNIIVRWDQPAPIVNYAEVWRAEITEASPNPIFEDAVFAGTGPFMIYSETLPQTKQYRYWVRFVSLAGITGPVHDLAGTDIATSLDPAVILELLQNQIDRSHLATALSDELDLFGSDIDTNYTLVTTETQQRIDADGLLSQQITSVEGSLSGQIGAVQSDLSVVTDDTNNLLASWTMKVTLDANGTPVVGGIGLAAEVINGQPTTSFAVQADRISFTLPGHDSFALGIGTVNGRATVVIPNTNIGDATITNAKVTGGIDVQKLQVYGNATLNGETFITDGTIGSAKIAGHIKSPNWSPGNLGAQIPGSGWKIWTQGDAEGQAGDAQFFNVVARGDIEASGLRAGTADIVDTIHLRQQAVTFPVSYWNPNRTDIVYYQNDLPRSPGGSTLQTTPWRTLGSLSFTSSGAPKFISGFFRFAVQPIGRHIYYSDFSDYRYRHRVVYRILRDGVEYLAPVTIWSGLRKMSDYDIQDINIEYPILDKNFSFSDISTGARVYTYTLQIRFEVESSSEFADMFIRPLGSVVISVWEKSILSIETKR